ncbi:hypothetical protein BC833DRAFT_59753 [Globomyces pollinis-pini]|nr:hypothetical protein BC833DRAFT_59753 [Globomyces pollinis-pini]
MAPSDIWNPSLPQSSTSQQKPVQNWKSVNSSWRTNAQIPHNIGLEDKEVQRPSEPTEWIRRDSAQPKREIRRAQSSVLLSRPQNTSSHSNRNSFGQYTKPKSDNLYTPHKVGAVVEPHQNVNAPQFEKGNHFVSNLNTESSKFSIKNQEHKHRPSFPSTPNRFVTQQLKQGSRESLKATPLMKKKSKLLTEPIGMHIQKI